MKIQNKILKPQYEVELSEVNIKALLEYYFPFLEMGDFDRLYQHIKVNNFTFDDLEFWAESILPNLKIIFSELDNNPTQTNLMEYAIETMFDIDWDSLEKSEERKVIIEKLTEEIGLNASEYKESKYFTIEEVYEDYYRVFEWYGDPDDMLHEAMMGDEISWTSSPYYDDQLDTSEQSAAFWDDVL